MIKKVKVLYYDRTSISAKAIARFKAGKHRISPTSTTFNPRIPTLLINWGWRGTLPANFNNSNIELFNKPEAISLASNKINCLRTLEAADVPSLAFATNMEDAEELLTDDLKVYCRKQISSHSGRGIVIASSSEELVEASLYTQEFKNNIEYRVHVFDGKVIDIQQKKKMSEERRLEKGITVVKHDVRNLMNGWSFVRTDLTLVKEDGEPLVDLVKVPIDAVRALGLDFGAVDIAYNVSDDEIVVIEVNTAAGQKVGTTTNYNYIKAIFKKAGDPVSIAQYNARWNSEISEFDNGVNQLIEAANG
jgi:glutathione synthase/RimK-type ligase-like ATP-grasp enzyme